MENASKALLMAGGVIIGILILSLAVFLFVDFGTTSNKTRARIEENRLAEYNAQYTVYSGRTNITIYEIISLANLAEQNNKDYKDYSEYEERYKVQVYLGTSELNIATEEEKETLIDTYNAITDEGDIQNTFKCTDIQYHQNGGKIATITFRET